MAAFERQGPVRAACEVQIVRDVKRSQLAGAMQILEQVHDHFAGPEIEIAGGFVRQKDVGVAHQRAGQYDSLLFSAR